MDFLSFFQTQSEALDTVYDLFSFSYSFLHDTVGGQEEADFISKYILTNPQSQKVNPNLKALKNFSSHIEKILLRQEEEGISFETCLLQIEAEIHKKKDTLIDFGKPEMNDAAIPLFLLYAIDRYVMGKGKRCTDPEPVNKCHNDQYCIYLNEDDDLLKEASKRLRFSKRIRDLSLRNQFSRLAVLEKKSLPEGVSPPRIISLNVDRNDRYRRQNRRDRIWRVAVVPFGRHDMTEKVFEEGASYRIKYKEEHLRQGKERAVSLLDRAIDAGANMIIFPEYVCFPEMQGAIQAHLQRLYRKNKKKLHKLFLVVAGSGWYEGDNNIACIYSYSGTLIGRQYKYARYHNSYEGASGDMSEHLTEPGKEVTLVKIEGVGKCMTAICRDIPDKSYIYGLTSVFLPTFLFIPAWSPSVNIGFKEPLKEITAGNHMTSSILCNCCEAIQKRIPFKEESGLIVTPYKKDSVVTGKEVMIRRCEKTCDEKCEEGGCIQLVHMNFGIKAVKEGNMIQRIEQI